MSDRPGYLIIVTNAGQTKLDLFSAHHTEHDASTMRDRLEALLPDGTVHMIAVPEIDGVVAAASKPMKPEVIASAPVAAASPSPAPAPFKRAMTADEFAEETRQLMENGANGIFRDADAPLADGGAIG